MLDLSLTLDEVFHPPYFGLLGLQGVGISGVCGVAYLMSSRFSADMIDEVKQAAGEDGLGRGTSF